MSDKWAAVAAFRQARTADSHYALGYLNAAQTLWDGGAAAEAINEIELGCTRLPRDGEIALLAGELAEKVGRSKAARSHFHHVLQLGHSRSTVEALKGLARLEYADANVYGAIEQYKKAAQLAPNDWTVLNSLGNCFLDLGLLREATTAYRKAIDLRPDLPGIYDNLLLSHQYDPEIGPEEMFAAHREWERRYAVRAATRPPKRVRSGRVRVGLLSHAFARGPTGFFLLPLLRNIDRTKFEIFAYSVGAASDAVTEEIRALVDDWKQVSGATDEVIATRIRDDGIDVLIDLSGHAPGNRLAVMSHRPAPHSITWLDYVDTTGLTSIDLFIGDSIAVPPDGVQRFSERVARVGVSRLCYAPPEYLPPVSRPPILRHGYPTFGSFNRVSKIAPPTIDAWSELLDAVPDAKLLLKSGLFANRQTIAGIANRFATNGIDPSRIEFRGQSPHPAMLEEYSDVDIALDTFPFNGGLTTCEALAMGVPVVAMVGDVLVSRQSASLLTAAGLPQFIAHSRAAWIDAHRAMVESPNTLARIRSELRSTVFSSALCDGASFARRFEAILLELHQSDVVE